MAICTQCGELMHDDDTFDHKCKSEKVPSKVERDEEGKRIVIE